MRPRDGVVRLAVIFLVIGPPAAGKSTWVRQHAQQGDIIIDFDAIAAVLTPLQPNERKLPAHVSAVTKAARRAAIDMALECATGDVYIIHAVPSAGLRAFYERRGAQIVVIDPGENVVLARCKQERPWQMVQVAKQWYRDKNKPRPAPVSTNSVAMQW